MYYIIYIFMEYYALYSIRNIYIYIQEEVSDDIAR